MEELWRSSDCSSRDGVDVLERSKISFKFIFISMISVNFNISFINKINQQFAFFHHFTNIFLTSSMESMFVISFPLRFSFSISMQLENNG